MGYQLGMILALVSCWWLIPHVVRADPTTTAGLTPGAVMVGMGSPRQPVTSAAQNPLTNQLELPGGIMSGMGVPRSPVTRAAPQGDAKPGLADIVGAASGGANRGNFFLLGR